jgi:hypothetical protein
MTGFDLSGVYDIHLHTSPDVSPRSLDDIEAATQAAEAGMRGILFKSHHTITADRATIAGKMVPGIKVYGSLALNDAVGGLNIEAVEAALRLGAREIFMPTISAANHRRAERLGGGISIMQNGQSAALQEIIALIRQYDAVLGTGHLSKEEIWHLVGLAKGVRLKKILVTHPEHPLTDLTISEQLQLREEGACFERCYASSFPQAGAVPLERLAREIKEVGPASTILTTDLGAAGYPLPVKGMQSYLSELQKLGIRKKDMDLMVKDNPKMLVDK